MRMEELSESRYIKQTDSVEKYLLNLVQEYFKNNSNVSATTSREYIIQKAVKRMKEEIKFDGIGVLSITLLPDDETRTGAVTISLEDLKGEPIISPKHSAFNVPFGDEQNTACEGNDPRLSDARTPLEHKHEISDINGLEGILSTLKNMLDRIDDFQHIHDNKNILDIITYSGNKTSIDLGTLDSLSDEIDNICEQINQDIITYKQDIESSVVIVDQKIDEIDDKIEELKEFITTINQQYYDSSKQYTNESIDEAKNDIDLKLNNDFVKKTNIKPLLDCINETYTFVGEMVIDLSNDLNFSERKMSYEYECPILDNIINELNKRNQDLSSCSIKTTMEYTDKETRRSVVCELPFVEFDVNTINSIVTACIDEASKKIHIYVRNSSYDIPNTTRSGIITIKFYSKPSSFTL